MDSISVGRMGQMNDFANEQNKQKQYHNISQSDIDSIKSQLPIKDYYEFMYHSWYTNKLENVAEHFAKWKPWDEWDYPIDDLIRFKKVLLDNEVHIKGKNVLDIGSHLGYLTLFSLNLNCKNIVVLEPLNQKLELSNFVCKKAGFKNFTFIKGSTHEENFMQYAPNVDTVILSALIYLVPDHFRLLEKITKSSAKCLIIENREKKDIAFDVRPQVFWEIENTANGKGMGGWRNNEKEFLVGTPNQSFLNSVMFELGWTIKRTEYFNVHTHLDNQRLMSTTTYVR